MNYIITIFALIGVIFILCAVFGYIAYKLDSLTIDISVDERE